MSVQPWSSAQGAPAAGHEGEGTGHSLREGPADGRVDPSPRSPFLTLQPPSQSLPCSAEGDEKCSLGLLLISSLGTGNYCVCTGGSSNLNAVTALLMVLALADSRAQPGTQQQECLWSPARATELQSPSCASCALIPARAGVLRVPCAGTAGQDSSPCPPSQERALGGLTFMRSWT